MYTIDNKGCWIWDGAKDAAGYGFKKYQGKQWKAHRWMYTQHKGAIPEGKVLLHTCDNPSCVNPEHLRIGTHQDNSDDMFAKGRQPSTEWRKQHAAKVFTKDVQSKAGSAGRRALNAQRVVCQVCGAVGNPGTLGRWHKHAEGKV